jgi:hypothetical protein
MKEMTLGSDIDNEQLAAAKNGLVDAGLGFPIKDTR